MILVTVGMQLGFDRLIEAMDNMAPDLAMPVVAQTGKGRYQPQNIEVRESIAPDEFEKLAANARLIVSHAGIGTVLTAQRVGAPILLVPRRAEFGEHRNDHQLATVAQLDGRHGILVALDLAQLREKITDGLTLGSVSHQVSEKTVQLRNAIAQFIADGKV